MTVCSMVPGTGSPGMRFWSEDDEEEEEMAAEDEAAAGSPILLMLCPIKSPRPPRGLELI